MITIYFIVLDKIMKKLWLHKLLILSIVICITSEYAMMSTKILATSDSCYFELTSISVVLDSIAEASILL